VYSIIKKDDKFSGTKDKVLGKTKKRGNLEILIKATYVVS
jgi:hypothetical protein